MKQVLLTLFASVLSLGVQAQDLIIFRDGSEIVATVQQVSETLVTCQEGKKKDLRTTQYDTKTVYMIKYERRGNVYFREDGSHTYGGGRKEDIKREVNLPKDATIIYTTDAHEIVAYEVSIGNVVTYKLENKKKAVAVVHDKISGRNKGCDAADGAYGTASSSCPASVARGCHCNRCT